MHEDVEAGDHSTEKPGEIDTKVQISCRSIIGIPFSVRSGHLPRLSASKSQSQ